MSRSRPQPFWPWCLRATSSCALALLACTPAPSASAPPALQSAAPEAAEPSPAATPPEIPADYELVYSQDFSTPAALEDFVFANPGEWAYVAAASDEGRPYLELRASSYTPPQASPHALALLDGLRVSSFVLELELLQTSADGDAHRDMCVVFGFADPSAFYYAHISTQHDAVAHNLHIVDHADRRAITTAHSEGYAWGRDQWQRIRVTRDAASGRVLVLDLAHPEAPLLEASDTTFDAGHIGFGSFDNTGQIASVKLWAPSSEAATLELDAPWARL